MAKEYCLNCDNEVEFEIQECTIKTEIKGSSFEYLARIPYCKECGEEIYIAELSDENIRRANERYREVRDLIQVDEIQDILQTYEIGQKPLANLLGWGEATISRYLAGLTPTREYSQTLKRLKSPEHMFNLFEQRGSVLTSVAKRKLKSRLAELLNPEPKDLEETKLHNVARYFLSQIDADAGESVTPLKLQKLVYYVQAWFLAFYHKAVFEEDAQAWIHGPVYPSLYYLYRNFGYNNLPKVANFDSSIFLDDEREMLEMVWLVYGKYDAKYLEKLTHHEDPWRISRYGLNDADKSTRPITKDLIENYYTEVKEDNGIHDLFSLNHYVSRLIF